MKRQEFGADRGAGMRRCAKPALLCHHRATMRARASISLWAPRTQKPGVAIAVQRNAGTFPISLVLCWQRVGGNQFSNQALKQGITGIGHKLA